MNKLNVNNTADTIINIFREKGGRSYAGESITQLEHACQAAQLAELICNDDNDVILAAFLHDIGHLIEEDSMFGFGVKNHEIIGGEYLHANGFSDKVVRLVKSHVETKRYLCYTSKWYYENLSAASKETLIHQGGPMTINEVIAFEENPLKHLMIKLRIWDDMAKEKHKQLPDLDIYREMIINHLLQTI